MAQIIPAILATKEEDYRRDIGRIERSLLFKEGWVHIDLMDNLFVQNKSIKPSAIANNHTALYKEAHLMVSHPLEWIDDLISAGFKRIIFHLEAQDVVINVINQIKNQGLEVGLAIKNDTSLEKLQPFLEKLDVVLLMGVVPGFQGQKFIPETINRIKEVVNLRSQGNYNFKIGVDGAAKDDNIKGIVEAGADFVAVGSFLLKGDIDENLEALWEAING
ncbi:ribulose-phosphate 3-epimerase [Candidatus Daviesbacteria bacterium]|nr:ribulose-phosphate 3-epimerase [Candidatus Daviesbacteria bacterium]